MKMMPEKWKTRGALDANPGRTPMFVDVLQSRDQTRMKIKFVSHDFVVASCTVVVVVVLMVVMVVVVVVIVVVVLVVMVVIVIVVNKFCVFEFIKTLRLKD